MSMRVYLAPSTLRITVSLTGSGSSTIASPGGPCAQDLGWERSNLNRPPPSQVDRCHPVPVHYDSTVSAPELTSQSLVRLESLPASRTSHTRTSCVSFAQTDNRKTEPSGLILDLSLSLSETPTVHSTPIPSTLTIPLPVETPYALNILQNYLCSMFNRPPDNPIPHVLKSLTR